MQGASIINYAKNKSITNVYIIKKHKKQEQIIKNNNKILKKTLISISFTEEG